MVNIWFTGIWNSGEQEWQPKAAWAKGQAGLRTRASAAQRAGLGTRPSVLGLAHGPVRMDLGLA
ncbi:hypothetical protein COLO4_05308 [Corchorus olitorius]|uniref:Uncharacterized protein n=1 Tax=Corchorus olitorius TaxID=93759 RepID=A0A1R3KRB3_9ROSI|nr:hypothetical protein COLO4_05308 [Corchorus olitorius]